MERWPEKSADEFNPFCGKIALIFLGFLLLFCQEKSKETSSLYIMDNTAWESGATTHVIQISVHKRDCFLESKG